MDTRKQLKTIELILRVAVFGIFLGHGMFAYGVKEHWIEYLEAAGFSYDQATVIMPYIGILDFFVAGIILLFPVRIIVLWAVIWAFATALMRPVSGEPIWDFVERGGNWGAPLALLFVLGIPRSFKEWFTPRNSQNNVSSNQ